MKNYLPHNKSKAEMHLGKENKNSSFKASNSWQLVGNFGQE